MHCNENTSGRRDLTPQEHFTINYIRPFLNPSSKLIKETKDKTLLKSSTFDRFIQVIIFPIENVSDVEGGRQKMGISLYL